MSGLNEFSIAAARRTDAMLDELLPAETEEPMRLHSAMRWSTFAGGKRFRPLLVFAVGDLFGVSPERIVRTAAAIEMVHTFSLIHDDLPAMDDDDLRRGKPTCHIKFDEATAILAGDALLALAFKAIADDTSLETDIRLRLIAELAEATGTPKGMVAGQQLDILSEDAEVNAEELERIHLNKTGALIRFSARAAALAAKASVEDLSAITDFATRLGLLFQITDDVLDATQPTSVLGKTAGKDAERRKSTYVSLFAIDGARSLAEETNAAAVASLAAFGGRAEMLRQIARATLARTA
ncbi:MAG: farnesyl-diphosphate synthase [Acidobacteria bacterium OLB17]|nr:MAG: farnesyl-diphosphate synthase [Acidobacteria bacterium OLB17]MCZ2390049.1 polyprenyl synthetase family protein [Acidobacteriota bacterium]